MVGIISTALVLASLFLLAVLLGTLLLSTYARRRRVSSVDPNAASNLDSEIDLILRRRDVDVPVGNDEFVGELRKWLEPSLATTALSVQSLQLLGYDAAPRQKEQLRNLVSAHWIPAEKGFAAVPGAHATIFGCWCARTIIRAAENLPYGDDEPSGSLRDAMPPQLTAEEWKEGLLSCQIGTKGFSEQPGMGPVGPVTTDAAIAVLHDIGSPLPLEVLAKIAAYEVDQCIDRPAHQNGSGYLIGTYIPRESDSSLMRLGDGVATRHVVRKMRWLTPEIADSLFRERLPGLVASYSACSGEGKRPCTALPGGKDTSVRDTQAWYEVGRLLAPLVGDSSLFPEHVPLEVIEYLERSQDESGGFGFYIGGQPNILATRSAALIYYSVVSANPSLASTMSTLRSRMVEFIESLRIAGTMYYRGYGPSRQNGTASRSTKAVAVRV